MASFKFTLIVTVFLLYSIHELHSQHIPLADSYFSKASDFKKEMKQDSALFYYKKAALEFQTLNRTEEFIESYNQIGIILTRQDKYEKAKSYLDQALSLGLSTLDSNNLTVANTYISLGVVYNAEGNYKQALAYHHEALAIRLIKLGEFHADVATSYGNLGNVYRNNEELDKSIAAHAKALAIREKVFGLSSPEIVESYVGLGNSYKQKQEYSTSLTYFEKALKNKISQRGEGHRDLVRFYKYVSEIYLLMGDSIKGAAFREKWKAIENK